MANVLFIFNEPPYGSEGMWNGLRLALTLARKEESANIRVFLVGDSAVGARKGQKVPQGYYNLESIFKGLVSKEISISTCGTCMDARGIQDGDLIEGIKRGSMDELSDCVIWAGKVLTF